MKPIGSDVKLTYQTDVEVAGGDALVTGTGRTYVVQLARRMCSSRPGPPLWALRCIVAAAPPDGARVHRLVWWRR